jgi:NAD(P)H dehydrogenase (quinone)
MYAITGITGKVGGALGRALLADRRPVRAVIRDIEKGRFWASQGCEIARAEMQDPASLTTAFTGTDGVFILPLRSSIRRRAFPRRARSSLP